MVYYHLVYYQCYGLLPNGVNAVMNAFNRAYDVTETRSFIKTRALSIVFTLAIIFMIVFALIVPVFGQVIEQRYLKQLGYRIVFLTCGVLRG